MIVTRQIERAAWLAQERCGVPVDVTIRRVPYLLEPGYGDDEAFEEAHVDRLARKFAKGVGAADSKTTWAALSAEERVALQQFVAQRKNCGANPAHVDLDARGKGVGITFTTRRDDLVDGMWVHDRVNTSSVASHRLVRWGAQFGKSEELFAVINRKHFVEGCRLNDRAMLALAAAEVGLSSEDAAEYLTADREGRLHGASVKEVREEAEHARKMMKRSGAGCAIPYAVIEGGHAVQGAESAEVFEQVFSQLVDPDGSLRRAVEEAGEAPISEGDPPMQAVACAF